MKINQELQELRGYNKKELFNKLQESEKKLTELQFKASFKKLKNYREIIKIKKRIARIWTILRESLNDPKVKNEKQ